MKIHRLVYHLTFILVFSSLLFIPFNSYAQTTEEKPSGFASTPKLIVFGFAVVISIITDGIGCLALAGGFRPLRAIISSLPWSFVNVYWWDFIAPSVAGIPFLTMKFMEIGNYGYWIGSNVIISLIGNLILEQAVFRFARGAAASGWGMDIGLAVLDAFLPAILFIVLPMAGII